MLSALQICLAGGSWRSKTAGPLVIDPRRAAVSPPQAGELEDVLQKAPMYSWPPGKAAECWESGTLELQLGPN